MGTPAWVASFPALSGQNGSLSANTERERERERERGDVRKNVRKSHKTRVFKERNHPQSEHTTRRSLRDKNMQESVNSDQKILAFKKTKTDQYERAEEKRNFNDSKKQVH